MIINDEQKLTDNMDRWKYIKVFVSSTFLDMDVERDTLKNIVEPRLNEVLKELSCNIEFIDLRHSVKTTSTLSKLEREKQIFSVCLEEIDSCRPYFVGILGHRYGWVPADDGLPCPHVDIPEDFPVEEKELSVTMYEFLHGMFSPNFLSGRAIVFLRNNCSYFSLPFQEKDNYIEQPKRQKYIKEIRDYIVSNKSKYKIVDYTLPLGSFTDSDILGWTELVVKHIKELIKDELTRPDVDKYESYSIAHEGYVQEHLINFQGREKEQKECIVKIEKRGCCYIASKKRGLGLSSFFCKIYDNMRQDNDKVCLIYCEDAVQSYTPEEIMICWLLQLDSYGDNNRRQDIISSANDQDRLISLWMELTSLLIKRGYIIYRFCETLSSAHYLDQHCAENTSLVSTVYYFDEISYMRPLMYMLEPFCEDTVSQILSSLRPEVKDVFMNRTDSLHAKWLMLAMTIVNKLNKMDFSQIRSRQENDNEQRIIRHQMDIVKNLPADYGKMVTMWTDRLKSIFGSEQIDNYLFLMTLNDDGWRDNMLAESMHCDFIMITSIRQMFGKQIVKQTKAGLWSFANSEIKEYFSQKYKLADYVNLMAKAYQCIRKLPAHDAIYEQLVFKFAMLNYDIDFCSEYIATHLKDDLPTTQYAKESFVWYAFTYKFAFLNFIFKMASQPKVLSYQFYHHLLQWTKILNYEDTLDVLLACVERIYNSLRNLWQKNVIDLRTYSISCDALACRTDYYQKMNDFKRMYECIEYGIQLSRDYYCKDANFLSHYHDCIRRKKNFIRDKDEQYSFLNTMFIIPERRGQFKYDCYSDTTCYAFLMSDAVEIMVETGHKDEAEELCNKSMRLLIDLLESQKKKLADTILTEADTKRNLVVWLFSKIRLHYHYNFLSFEQMAPICEEVLCVCDDCRLLKDKDFAYEYYHKAKAASIFIQDNLDSEEKCRQLLKLIEDIEKNYNEEDTMWSVIFFITQRNTKYVNPQFDVWLYANSLAMYLLSDLPEGSVKIESGRGMGGLANVDIKEEPFSFESHLRILLPLIGAKGTDKMGLPPSNLLGSMVILYLSMIVYELRKENIDLQYLVELYNSCTDVLNAIHEQDFSIPLVAFMGELMETMEFLSENLDNNRNELDLQARYRDFRDSFGFDGDIRTSQEGYWENGDPELKDVE